MSTLMWQALSVPYLRFSRLLTNDRTDKLSRGQLVRVEGEVCNWPKVGYESFTEATIVSALSDLNYKNLATFVVFKNAESSCTSLETNF